MKRTIAAILTVLSLLSTPLARLQAAEKAGTPGRLPGCVLVEAEGFAQHGGWVVDQQFMDQMGSPFLLAHGLGKPVADAKATVTFAEGGEYRLWVRTRDWVGPWKTSDIPATKRAHGSPGVFKVLINGKPVGVTFGEKGAEWHWQNGGSVSVPNGKTEIALHDLTGFEGRCDAVLFVRDEQFTPPNRDPEMATFRRACLGQPEQPETVSEFDFVVTGGGIAGTCAALSAARLGMKVALIQDRPVLGGNNSSEVRVWLHGARNKEPWPRIGDVVAELEQEKHAHYGPKNVASLYEDDKKLALVRSEPNIRLFLGHRANGVEAKTADGSGRIVAVIAQDICSGLRVRVAGHYFADCTGDATIGALAGADLEAAPKAGHMGPSNLWNVDKTDQPQPFPRCPWALDLSSVQFPKQLNQLGGWYWESGFTHDPIAKMEYVRDLNFRAMYGAWDALKNVDKKYPNYKLNWSAYIMGKRESRRLMGDVVLTVKDLKESRPFKDGCFPCTWGLDTHYAHPKYQKGFEGDEFISIHTHGKDYTYKGPYWGPYRCLYSRNVANLFMAGRNISTTQEALGATRVMRTCGTMGEVVGMAASLCKKHDVTPRDIYHDHLAELQGLMRVGVGKDPAAAAKPYRH